MDELIPFLTVAAPVTVVAWLLHRRFGHRPDHPLWPAFNATAGAALFIATGTTGYNLNNLEVAATGTRWAGTVIWWELGIGLALVPVAVYYWRKGLRSVASA